MKLRRGKETEIIIAVYGPNQNEKQKIKEEFWNTLQETIKRNKGHLFISGNLNTRVGNYQRKCKEATGNNGEKELNNIGTDS